MLGAIYAIAKYLEEYFEISCDNLRYDMLLSALKNKPPVTFVTATDGNHGKAVSRAAKLFNQNAIVFLPKGSAKARLEAILAEGANASILDLNYDQAVEYVANLAKENNYVLIQDTALDNYSIIPTNIMKGYQTIVFELVKQLNKNVTHVFLQAGVGSFASSFINAFINLFDYKPKFIIIEPQNANCYFNSAKSNGDHPERVTGDLHTIMAGLACGEPNPIAYPIIKNNACCYLSVNDFIAELGMKTLAYPLGDDLEIKAGESGCVGIGVINELMLNKKYAHARERLNLNSESIALVVNTEGVTDPKNYYKIVNKKN
ncbi:MAG: diaminopropionate ammonia-lyase [Clostridia bacterium]